VERPGRAPRCRKRTCRTTPPRLIAKADRRRAARQQDRRHRRRLQGRQVDLLEQTYTAATVLHFQLEPLNALAFEKDGVMEIHTGNQWQSLILPTLAKALGSPETRIVMRTYMLGGGFGRRLNGDYAVPAALAAKALGKPVKLVLTREDDVRFDSVRSPSVQTVRMAFDGAGNILAQEHHAAAGWPTLANAPALMPKGKNGVAYDPFAISGADHWYEVGAHKVRAINNDLANSKPSVPAGCGRWARAGPTGRAKASSTRPLTT
jgi:CO/xanthine dehydrogenase Mo-binding subunit